MKGAFLLVGILGVVVTVIGAEPPGTDAPTEPEAGLRVMSFNIRYANPADGPDAWPNRREMVARLMHFHAADLVGAQEVLKGQLDDLERLLPEYGWVGVGRDDGREAGEFCPILYRRSRLEVLASETFWLSETPDRPSKSWDSSLNRIVTWARLRDRRTGLTFVHFNTHFDHRGEEARRQSARLLRERAARLAGEMPFIVTGDFNATSESEPYRILAQAEAIEGAGPFLDAQALAPFGHHGPKGTFWGFGETCVPDKRIDFIFVRTGIAVLRYGHLSDTYDGRHPSDHLPVLAEVAIGRAGR